MRQRLNKTYPYPVLSTYTDDYIDGKFESNVSSKINGFDLELQLETTVENDTLVNLLNAGQAEIVFHIECPVTGFREVVTTHGESKTELLSHHKIRDLVEINTFIVAKERIDNFSSPSFNEDYEDMVINIDADCVLAVAEELFVTVPPKIQEKLENNETFINIIPNDDNSIKEISVYFDRSDKLLIKIPNAEYSKYSLLWGSSNNRPIFTMMIIVNALFSALVYLKEKDPVELQTALDDSSWVRSLDYALKTRFDTELESLSKKNLDELYSLAQKMSESPFEKSVSNLMNMGGEA